MTSILFLKSEKIKVKNNTILILESVYLNKTDIIIQSVSYILFIQSRIEAVHQEN